MYFGAGIADQAARVLYAYFCYPAPTPTNTSTPTNTAVATNTPTNTPTDTPAATNTPTNTPTSTPTSVGSSNTLVYLHGDHLGSISVTTSASGMVLSRQEFDPWGKVRSGGVAETKINYTGQHKDDTGLLYYHARYYDPNLARFISPDSIVPGAAAGAGGAGGTIGAWENSSLTVDFHEIGFTSAVQKEHAFILQKGFSFQLSNVDAGQADKRFGPHNPQALGRYVYSINNPVRYTDPTGHVPLPPQETEWSVKKERYLEMGNPLSVIARAAARRAFLTFTKLGRLISRIPKAKDLTYHVGKDGKGAASHDDELITQGNRAGQYARPYMRSNTLIDEIMQAKDPILDPKGNPHALRWEVEGSFRGSKGIWELVVDVETKEILHFLFKSTR